MLHESACNISFLLWSSTAEKGKFHYDGNGVGGVYIVTVHNEVSCLVLCFELKALMNFPDKVSKNKIQSQS